MPYNLRLDVGTIGNKSEIEPRYPFDMLASFYLSNTYYGRIGELNSYIRSKHNPKVKEKLPVWLKKEILEGSEINDFTGNLFSFDIETVKLFLIHEGSYVMMDKYNEEFIGIKLDVVLPALQYDIVEIIGSTYKKYTAALAALSDIFRNREFYQAPIYCMFSGY